MTTVDPLDCPKCGASLDVPEGATVLTCRFCKSKCQLRETASVRALVLIEEKLDVIIKQTAKTEDDVRDLQEGRRAARSKWEHHLHALQGRLNAAANTIKTLEEKHGRLTRRWHETKPDAGFMFALGLGMAAGVLAIVALNYDEARQAAVLLFALAGALCFLVAPVWRWGSRSSASSQQDHILLEIRSIEGRLAEMDHECSVIQSELERWKLHEPPLAKS